MTINWLHLSDFHIGKEYYFQQNICNEIVNHVKERIQQEKRPLDFVFITGDLANKGKANEFEDFYNNFFIQLVDAVDLDLERIFIVPGNHDVNIGVGQAVERFGVFNRLQNFFDPTDEGLQDRKYLFERFAEYLKHDIYSPKVEGKHWLESSLGASIRKFDDINGHKVGIVGLNTAWLSEGDKPDKNNLTPGVEITANALASIKDREIRIVLGHHPLSWWVSGHTSPEDCKEVRTLFGQDKVIYLHGHLHVDEETYEYGSAQQFLSIGAGACFAARKDDNWKNGLLWGSLDAESEEVFIEPLIYKRGERKKWVFDSNVFSNDFLKLEKGGFAFPIPQPLTRPTATSKSAPVPLGWRKIDKKFLHDKYGASHSSGLVDFFDGAVPTWTSVLSTEIPRRPVTQLLVDEFSKAVDENNGICVRVLLGAGGEGKTTILMQTIIELLSRDDDWNILWQESVTPDQDELNWPEEYFENLPEGQGRWLIVTDAADTVIRGLSTTLGLLKNNGREDVHFLASCRTSDWMTAEANRISWESLSNNFEKINLSLKPEEAEGILKAWKKYGGLKGLDDVSTEDAIKIFREAAVSEAGRNNEKHHDEGTLLGAMLTLRYGKRLRSHVLNLLQKLNKNVIIDDNTLLDAYALIAIPHAENVRILSKTVLAKAIGCKRGDLNSKILSKLADEAAILTPSFAGKYQENILTRHQSIAETVREVLIREFNYDVEEKVYVHLIQSAIKLYHDELGKVKVPYLREWYRLPDYFFQQGDIPFAIRLIEAEQEVEPQNPFYITQLARLFRDKTMFSEAAELFRDAPEGIQRDRAYYTEWGTCQGRLKNYELGIWLTGISLSDILETRISDYKATGFDDKTIKAGLYNLSLFFKALYSQYVQDANAYFEAYGACVFLSLKSRTVDEELKHDLESELGYYTANTKSNLLTNGTNPVSIIDNGIRVAGQQTEKSEFPGWLKPAYELTFRDLERYFGFRS